MLPPANLANRFQQLPDAMPPRRIKSRRNCGDIASAGRDSNQPSSRDTHIMQLIGNKASAIAAP